MVTRHYGFLRYVYAMARRRGYARWRDAQTSMPHLAPRPSQADEMLSRPAWSAARLKSALRNIYAFNMRDCCRRHTPRVFLRYAELFDIVDGVVRIFAI